MSVDTTRAPLLGEPIPVELMNTVWADRDGVHDALADPAEAAAWLRAAAPRIEITPPELRPPAGDAETGTVISDLRDLRNALRQLAAEVTGDRRSAGRPGTEPAASRAVAVSTINRAAAAAPAWPALSWPDDAPATRQLHSQGPAARILLAAIASQAISLFAEPDPPGQSGQPQLRACRGPGCVLYFVQQHPRREWCSAGCGNRARVARHYHRHRGSAAG
ncbi:MAG TPA: CGNR zinc finger domain-containing protein [Streptosporangiaceae bacterium]